MNAISNVSNQNISSYAPSTTNATQSVRSRDSDGDDDGNKKAGHTGRSNFLAAIEQALIQTLSNSVSTTSTSTTSTSGSTATASTTTASSTTATPPTTSTSSTTQSPQEALKTFIHSLFSALHGAAHSSATTTNGTPTTSGTPAANTTPTTGTLPAAQSGDSDGDDDGSTATSRVHHHEHGHNSLANKIQSLIQQLSASTQSTPVTGSQNTSTTTSQTPATTTTPSTTDPLSDLKTSFQNLINAVAASQNQAATNTSITLQTFLQNLLQDFNGGSSNTGTLINTQA